MKKFFIIFGILLIFNSSAFSSMSSYCSTPPFIGRTISPNVMIILDNSGSMYNFAYDYNGSQISTGFDPEKTYYGYFDSNYWYKYESEKFVPTALKSSRNKYSNEWDGNFLNWLTMRRVDIVRKVLVGGKYSGGYLTGEMADYDGRGYKKKVDNAENFTPYSETRCFEFTTGGSGTSKFKVCDSNCSHCSSYYFVKVKVNEQPKGIVQKASDKVRWGLALYHVNWSWSKQGGYVQVPIAGSSIEDMVNEINNTNSDSNTPLAETLWTVAGYFAQKASMLGGPGPRYQSGDYQINNNVDPYNHGTGDSPIWAWCAKSFVIYITDGEPCGDDNLPSELKTYASNNGGYDYTGSLPTCYAGGNNPWIEDVALYVHTNDLRDDLEGKQTLTIYPVFAFGSGSELLKDTSINGGFIDKNGNNEPDLREEWDRDGDNMPDNYYEAQSGYELENALTQAITDILKRTSSGTAASVLSTSTRGSGFLSQAYFLPQFTSENNEKLTWIGHLRGFWVDSKGQIREDTTSDEKLVLDEDKVMKYFLEESGGKTKAHLYSSDTTGKVEFPCSPDETKTLADLKTIWDAGKKLWEMSANSRTIYTSMDGTSLADFTTTNASTLKSYLRAYNQADAENIINYVRGIDADVCLDSDAGTCNTTGHRSRELTIGIDTHIWKLGDIVYSTPRVLSHFALGTYDILYGDDSYTEFVGSDNYKNRSDYLFVGANDGMLHCFYLGKVKEKRDENNPGLRAEVEGTDIGKEKWAYIPMNILPYLKYLAYPDYCHIYYVDQRPMLIDASIGGTAGSNRPSDGSSWRTILIGELRFGGSITPAVCFDSGGSEIDCSNPDVAKKVGLSSIFALDITNPESPSLLWEFSDDDLKFTTSYPAIVRIGDKDKNGDWYIVLGSGPSDYDGDVPPSTGYIYVIDLRDGTLKGKLNVGTDTYVGDCIAVDPDHDYTVEAIYCGTVKKQGSNLKGDMLRILTKGDNNPANWTVTTLYNADAPITASPELAFDEQGNLWCFWGTGKYFGQSDKTDDSQQYLYGMKDTCWIPKDQKYKDSCSPVTNIFDATNVKVEATVVDYICMCEGGETPKNDDGTCPEPSKKVVTHVKEANVGGVPWDDYVKSAMSGKDGWKIELSHSSPSERVISKPAVVGQLVMFTTFTPNEDICGFGGDSNLYSLYYKAGIPYKEPTILFLRGFIGNNISRSVYIGKGAPAIGEAITTKTTTTTKGGEVKTYVQFSTGKVVEVTQKPIFIPYKTQFWIER